MPNAKQPLQPNDFPVNAEGKKIKKQDGTPIADTDDPAVAETSRSALTTMKLGAKKTSGRPRSNFSSMEQPNLGRAVSALIRSIGGSTTVKMSER